MKLYAGIDLHANNSVVVVIEAEDRVLDQKRLRHELGEILRTFAPYRENLQGIVVESTDNWYWLVDGLMAAGYRVHCTLPARELDFGVSLHLSINELGRSAVVAERWRGLSDVR
jgi:transposase